MRAAVLIGSLFLSFPCLADCAKEAQAAVGFMDRYLAYRLALIGTQEEPAVLDWLAASEDVTPGFIEDYRQLEAQGLAQDPELGWNMDLLLDAQDSPDEGFRLAECSGQAGIVILQGIDWPEFHVAVRVDSSTGLPKVAGAGAVNIPLALRPSRQDDRADD